MGIQLQFIASQRMLIEQYLVSRDELGKTMIWCRSTGGIVWSSEMLENCPATDVVDGENNTDEHIPDVENADENEITEDEAENIIRSCGQQTPASLAKVFPVRTLPSCTARRNRY